MGTLDAIAVFAAETNNAEYLLWVKKNLDWALDTWCTRFGWTPGDLQDQAYEHETCSLVDAICTCITLAQNGFVEYWSIAEKFIRGHLCQSQLLDTSWIEQYDRKDKDTPRFRTYYKAADRLRGAFSGYAAPNDFVYDQEKGRGHIMDVQMCCVAAGVRALYKAWQAAVSRDKNRVWVNLLLNHRTPDIEVRSWLPHEGRLEVEISEDVPELMVRIPEWVPFGGVRVRGQVGDETVREDTGRTLSWVRRHYIKIKSPRKGEVVTITFTVDERETIETAVDNKYKVKWRGDDVTGISPRGSYYPLYDNVVIYDKVPLRGDNYPVAKPTLL
jgi:hypothetical protein